MSLPNARAPINERLGLGDALLRKLVLSKFEKTPNEFLPDSIFDYLVSDAGRQSIMKALNITQHGQESDDLVDFIQKKAIRVFAAAVHVHHGSDKRHLRTAMSWFHRNDFQNRNLPIEQWSNERFEENEEKGILHPFSLMASPEEDEVWTMSRIWEFQRHQFRFLAPVFSTDKPSHDAWDLTLPFVTKEHTYSKGSFGIVSKYEIHGDHIQGSLESNYPCPRIVAVKEIVVNDETDHQKVAQTWASEVKAMAMMNKLKQGHIVRFITAFRRGNPRAPEHYLMTEWADGGNLLNLWKKIPKPVLKSQLIREVVGQLLGLAEALNAAHYPDGGASSACYRHGDLKPENILWFPEEGKLGTLKICDWGCARNKHVMTALRHSKTSSQYGTHRYEPPEIDTGVGFYLPGREEKRISRLYDCWSFGCVALEFLVWLIYGFDGLEIFNQSVKERLNNHSSFYQSLGDRKAQVHNVATYWMDYMASDPGCRFGTTALGDILEIIQSGLLVVKLPRQGGTFFVNPLQQSQEIPSTPQQSRQINGNIPDERALGEANSSQRSSSAIVPSISITPSEPSEDDMNLRSQIPGPSRLRANELRDRLLHIATEEGEGYWSTLPKQSLPSIPDVLYSNQAVYSFFSRPERDRIDYGHPKLDPADWGFETDNEFAAQLFPVFNDTERFPIPKTNISSKLCDNCVKFRNSLWDLFFTISYDMQDLQRNAKDDKCDLCGLLWKTCERNWESMFPIVQFERVGSLLRINGGRLPVLSISRSFDCKHRSAADLQIGFAELPEVGSTTHFEVIRKWLSDCDDNHSNSTCKPPKRDGDSEAGTLTRLPTRLIDVGIDGNATVRLCETNAEGFVLQDARGWLALSHQWGQRPHFSTTTANIEDHLTDIKLAELPATFKDAILVTRALGRRYLWIDSLCIIQAGSKADFEQEGKRMEDVYSGAYCVIAATCATGHYSGMLKPRRKRDCVALCREDDRDMLFHVSERIDKFKEHVLDGALCSRGWVFQEHALARRTIFFSEHQTYWECGHGIRCETMTKLNNESEKLLGDPNFPDILDSARHGERILRLQELHQAYSRLGLTQASDRPRAVNGLEQRLLRTMKLKGGFGVFEDDSTLKMKGLLRRSLLWHRGPDTPSLHRIPRISVPSWSWMAYTGRKEANGTNGPGGINYYQPKFDAFDWEDFQTPWSPAWNGGANLGLIAQVRSFDRNRARAGEDFLKFDTPTDTDHGNSKCFVLGIQQGKMSADDKRHYVLVVVPTDRSAANDVKVYERVGAGYLPGRCFTGEIVPAEIQ